MNRRARTAVFIAAAGLPLLGFASSHREAPLIGGQPRVDGTDLYLFKSYENGRAAFVTVIANYIPFEEPAGGPNFYPLDTRAVYEILIDNDGDALPDWRFQFRFSQEVKNLTVPAGGQNVAVPLLNIGPVDQAGKALNVQESYTLNVQYGANSGYATDAATGSTHFLKPVDNIGTKSIADYATYANGFIYTINIPNCGTPGRVFVGQRKDPFVVNLGEIFDLVNLNPAGPRDSAPNTLSNKNVTSIALELPISCITRGKDPVIGAWTTASLPQDAALNPYPQGQNDLLFTGGPWVEVSRLGMPLVNEVVIGLPDKDRWNESRPLYDAQFLKYVTNPTLPVLLNALFGSAAMVPGTPRDDLVAAFLTGVKGLNQPLKVRPSEMMRLNTSIAATPPAAQNDLGVLGGDLAGFPNGRRPYDDVVDIELRVVEGALCGKIGNCGTQTSDPNNGTPYTDGARAAGADAASSVVTGAISAGDTYLDVFPYLATPIAGSPNSTGT
jgi:hypothetical protein